MKKFLVAITLFFSLSNITISQQLTEAWAKTAGGSGGDGGSAIAVDHHGSILVAGSFASTIFNIGNTSLTNAGGSDIFIAKYNTSGSLLWAKQYGGAGNEHLKAMVLSSDGSIYIADTFTKSFTIGTANLPAAPSTYTNVYIAKFDNDGVFQWVNTQTVHSSIDNGAVDLASDSHGSVYLNYVNRTKYSTTGILLFTGAGGNAGVSVDRFDNVHTWSNATGPTDVRNWYDSTGVSLGSAALSTATFRFFTWGYKAISPSEYYMIGQYIPLNGAMGDLQFGHNRVGGAGGGNCIDKLPVNAEADGQGNEFYAGSFSNACTPGPIPSPIFQLGSIQINSITGDYDIYVIRNSANAGVTNLSSTSGNGYTNETPSRIAVDTNEHSLYVIGQWWKKADSSKFYFGNSVLTNNGNGNSADMLLLKFDYGSAILSVNAGNDKAVCKGGSTTIGSIASGGTGAYTYRWSPSAGLSDSTIYSPVARPSTTTSYVLTVTDVAGATARDTVRVVVDSSLYRPTISLAAGGTNPFCQGNQIVLLTDAVTNYQWSNGSTSFSYPVSNTDTVTVTATRNDGCIGTSLPFYAIKKPLTAMPTISPNGPAAVCNGNTLTLTAQNSESNVNYQWNTGATTTSIDVSVAGTYSVTAKGTSGCTSTAATKTITLASAPTGTIVANGNTSFCSGDSVQLNISSTGNSIIWSNGSTASSIWVKSAGNYSATITSPQGCSTNAQNTITVAVVQAPPVPAINAGGPTSFCAGGSVVLTAQNTQSGVSYSWSNAATTTSITVNSSGVYSVKAINSTGCMSSPVSTTVVVNPLPTGTVSASGSTSFCLGDSVQLTANSTTASGYLWNTGAATQTLWVKSSGNYSVKLTSAAGCDNNASNTISTSVTSMSTPVISQTGNVLTVTPTANSYQWFLNGNSISGATLQTLTMTEGGGYSVRETNNGCSATAYFQGVLRVITPTLSFQVYPNPATEEMKLVYTLNSSERVSVSVSDMNGQRVISIVNNQMQSAGEHQYSLKSSTLRLQRGLYSLVIYIGDTKTVQRLIIL